VSNKPIVAIVVAANVCTAAVVGVVYWRSHRSPREAARRDAIRRIEAEERAAEALRREGKDPSLAQFRAESDDQPTTRQPTTRKPPPPPREVDAAALAPVLGPKPAQLGPLLDDRGDGDTAAYEEKYGAHVETSSERFGGPVVRFDGDGLRAAVEARWGPSDTGAYYDPAQHRRALVDDDAVRFGRYQTIDELVVPGEPLRLGVAPIMLVGETTEAAQDALGFDGRGLADAGQVEFYRPPLADSRRPVSVGVQVDKGIVSRVDVAVPIEGKAGADAVLAAFAKKLGPPTPRVDGASTWTRDGFELVAAQRDDLVRIKIVPAPAR